MGCCSHRHHRKYKKRRNRCVGVIKMKYKIYENCCNDIMRGCPSCGYEYHHPRHCCCPRCGLQIDDPTRFGGRGFGRMGGCGTFGGRFGEFSEPRFGRFLPFGFAPEFGEFEEEEEGDFF